MNQFLQEVKKELTLTTFPSRAVVIAFTTFVIIFTVVMAVYFGILDLGFGQAVINFINRF
jgi:preprotein translocase SecE subunit